jgi:hypothetical protein
MNFNSIRFTVMVNMTTELSTYYYYYYYYCLVVIIIIIITGLSDGRQWHEIPASLLTVTHEMNEYHQFIHPTGKKTYLVVIIPTVLSQCKTKTPRIFGTNTRGIFNSSAVTTGTV